MMAVDTKRVKLFFTVLGLAAFVAVSFLGVFLTTSMEMKEDGTMGGCIFDEQAICPMTLAEHLSRWRELFAFLPQKGIFVTQLLVLISTLVIATFALRRHLLLSLFSYFSEWWRLYIKNNKNLLFFDCLREAFSQGILNPHIYA